MQSDFRENLHLALDTVRAHKFSQTALDKIQKAGGVAEVI